MQISEIPVAIPGMGAIVHDAGTAFRVWAPHATAVAVTGDFCDWSEDAHQMAPEEGGYWYLDVPGVGAGAEYRFVIDGPAGRLSRIDPYARAVTSSVGNAIVTDLGAMPDDGFDRPAWNEMVVYEMHVGTFAAPEGDGVGDFDAAIGRLDHVAALGANAVQIMPAAEFAGDLSWGYNPAHIFAVESAYGGPEALRRFVAAAHERGLAVLLDVVYNHFGPSDLDLWQFDGWSENDKGGIYFYNDHRSATPWGDTRPDYGRPEVRQFIRDNALYWLETFGIDGLRFDMTLYMRNVNGDEGDASQALPDGWSLAQWINDEVARHFPGRITIAEDLRSLPDITAPTDRGGAGFGAQWDAGFVHPVRAALTEIEDDARSIADIVAALTLDYNGDPFQRVVYTESHDEVANGKARVPHEIDPEDAAAWHAQKRSTLGAALVFTAPGIPMIFQGQEMLEDGWFDDSDPLDWDKRDLHRGIARLYRDLIALRRDARGPARGLSGRGIEILHADDTAKTLVYRRFADDDDPGVVVAMNFRADIAEGVAFDLPEPEAWRLRFDSDWSGYSDRFGEDEAHGILVGDDGTPRVTLPAYTAFVFTR